MTFDIAAFEKAKFVHRTAVVPVAGLKAFFGKGKPEWTVRGATSEETFRAAEAEAKQKNMAAMVKALVASETTADEKTAAIKDALGISKKSTPGELAKRLELLQLCSVKPEIDLGVAVKIAETHPVIFYSLTNKILELTGQGQIPEEKR